MPVSHSPQPALAFDFGYRVTCDGVYVSHTETLWDVQRDADRHAMSALEWTAIAPAVDGEDSYDRAFLECLYQGHRYRITRL